MARFISTERSFAYLGRFAIAVRNLGFMNALQTFKAIQGGRELSAIRVPRLEQEFFFRSAEDKGAISHLFYPGTRILDTPECPVRTIVDAGANIGVETVRMLHFHPEATVLAIEPVRANYEILQKNIADKKERVSTVMAGLWSSNTRLKVLSGSGNEAFSVCAAEAETAGEIDAVTMQRVLSEVGGEIDILKMDIEGSEYEVFSKDTEWVNHVKAFVFECPDRDYPGAAFQIFRALAHLPLRTYISGENLVLIREDINWDMETTAYL